MSTFVRHNALRFPNDIALEDLESSERMSWSRVEAEVAAIASALADQFGVQRGDRVAYFAADRPLTFEVLFACMRLGAVFVPLNRRLSASEIELLCANAAPLLLLHDCVWSAPARAVGNALGVRTVELESELIPALSAAADGDAVPVGIAADEPIMLLYTSGTTGLPKGAIVTEGMLLAQALNVIDLMGITGPPAKYLSVLPLFHAAGLMAIALPILFRGGCVVIGSKFDPAITARQLADPSIGITHFNGPPVIYQLIAEQAATGDDFSHIRHGMVGGGKLADELAEFYFSRGLELQVGWGATEMGPSATIMPKGHSVARADTVGQLVPFTRLHVVADGGPDAGFGEEGEAWVSGPSISPAYWRQSAEEDANHHDGWYRSGDAVSVDADGFVTFRGRYKDMYKSGGENVFAAEVENVLLDHPAIAEAAVIGIPHSRWGEVGKAILVSTAGMSVTADAVIGHCRERLAGYKVPAEVVFSSTLPRNVTGKVEKTELRRIYGGIGG